MRKRNENIKTPDCQHCEHLEECLPWSQMPWGNMIKYFECIYV